MQITLFSDFIEELVAQDNPVRAIEAFVMTLDVSEMGFTKTQTAGNRATSVRSEIALIYFTIPQPNHLLASILGVRPLG